MNDELIKEKIKDHQTLLNTHEIRLDNIEKTTLIQGERIDSLIKRLDTLTKALTGLAGVIATAIIMKILEFILK